MSEYQYYEFQAIDRPLGEADREVASGFVDTSADHSHELHEFL